MTKPIELTKEQLENIDKLCEIGIKITDNIWAQYPDGLTYIEIFTLLTGMISGHLADKCLDEENEISLDETIKHDIKLISEMINVGTENRIKRIKKMKEGTTDD